MSEYTKGKLQAIGSTKAKFNDAYFIRLENKKDSFIALTYGHTGFPAKSNATELVRRWKAFEERGIVSDLAKDGENLLLFSECSPFCEDRKRAQDKFKITLAKAKPE